MEHTQNCYTALVRPTGVVDFAQKTSPEEAVAYDLQRANLPRALFLNRFAKYSAIAGGLFGAMGIAGVVAALTLDLNEKDKLELGTATAVLLLGGFLCCGITNCLYRNGCSGSSTETGQLEDAIRYVQ